MDLFGTTIAPSADPPDAAKNAKRKSVSVIIFSGSRRLRPHHWAAA